MAAPLMELRNVWRTFPSGEGVTAVLRDVSLTIGQGEFVAIVGASGSGKSTLMNILGCLDEASAGSYRVRGQDVARLDGDALAALRRDTFGFIFQRYHLLAELSAVGNVEVPAVYAGAAPAARRARAGALLGRLGLGDRLEHRPGQLSGGQQQRVSIARALMNGAEAILADEPTGALDSRSGEEVLRILEELNAEGRTVVIVTHDMEVARRARRIVELRDGAIVSDRPSGPAAAAAGAGAAARGRGGMRFWDGAREVLRMAFAAMRAHRLRTLLTMLGIVIGIAAVVNVVALGTGAQRQVLRNISGLGTNTLEVYPGEDMGDVRSGRIRTLVAADAAALAAQPYAAAVTPTVQKGATLRRGAEAATASVQGVAETFFDARGITLASGRLLTPEDVAARAQVAVIDTRTAGTMFGAETDPVGQYLQVGRMPARVVGVSNPRQGFGANENLNVYLPYTTVQTRMLGTTTLRSVMLKVADDADMAAAEAAVTALLEERHGGRDFFIVNTDEIRETITSTTQTMALLIGAIAVISLVVGGIGVMNIMLVSVSERVGEIGVRMAVGARRSDILRQFLAEATLVCVIAGGLGVVAALAIGAGISALGSAFPLVYSQASIVTAVASSMLIGVVFGYLPARRAAALSPVAALSPG
ncbi:MacB family efflux pump subunit [Amaricoccus sp.]|uniref:MacB family efflux pump subunit n=1 Tax=Amaricoccus sp. TaxID=1872485 RepID=UPI001B79842E|nr:MacB family efflux pump subunit [Amaricoccus sp.]MBP7001895.1 MacB family efflux pump subunit [Amaricoccus sp.]